MKTVCSMEEWFLVLSQRLLELQGPSCSGSCPQSTDHARAKGPREPRSAQPAALTSPVPAHRYPGTFRQAPGALRSCCSQLLSPSPCARSLTQDVKSIKSGAKWAFSDPASPSMGVLVHPGGVTKHHTPRSSWKTEYTSHGSRH